MFQILLKMLVGVLTKLATQEFFEKLFLVFLHWIVKNTNNNVDDAMGSSIADALGKKAWYDALK